MASGSKRRRGEGWELRVYAGLHPLTGKRRYVTKTVQGSEREADRALRRLLDDVDEGSRVAATGRRPLSPATVVRVHGIARVILEQARKWRWIARNPALDATPPSIPKRRPTTPGAASLAGFVAWVGERDADFALYLRLAAIVGARRAELCALRWTDLDLDAGRLEILRRLVAGRDSGGHEKVFELEGTKANAGHAVALDPVTVERLRNHRDACAERAVACGVSLPRDAHVFGIEPDGAVGWKPHSVIQRFRRLRAQAGLPPMRLHDVRHYVATHLIDQGVAVTTVSERIGHSSPRTTLGIYGQGVTETDHRAAIILAAALDLPASPMAPEAAGQSA